MADETDSPTDAAALGAGVVAVAMTVFGDPTAYDLLTVIVSAALMLLVLGYVARSRRDRRQSLAFAAVVSIIALPVLGYAVEGRPGPWAKPPALVPPGESTVSDEATVVAWAALSLLLFLLDRRRQAENDRHRRQSPGSVPS
jgi:membrane protein implicated in regulation of membrane protease activity